MWLYLEEINVPLHDFVQGRPFYNEYYATTWYSTLKIIQTKPYQNVLVLSYYHKNTLHVYSMLH